MVAIEKKHRRIDMANFYNWLCKSWKKWEDNFSFINASVYVCTKKSSHGNYYDHGNCTKIHNGHMENKENLLFSKQNMANSKWEHVGTCHHKKPGISKLLGSKITC